MKMPLEVWFHADAKEQSELLLLSVDAATVLARLSRCRDGIIDSRIGELERLIPKQR